MGYAILAYMNYLVDFLLFRDPFSPHGSLSFEIFQIGPFLTKLEVIFIFWGFLFSNVTT